MILSKTMGIPQERVEYIQNLLNKYSEMELNDILVEIFAEPDLSEIERIYTAFIVGRYVGQQEKVTITL